MSEERKKGKHLRWEDRQEIQRGLREHRTFTEIGIMIGCSPDTVSKEIRKIQNRVDYLEKDIGKLEKRQAAIEKVLSAPGPGDDVMELTREYLENKRSLDAFTEEWSVQMEKLEN